MNAIASIFLPFKNRFSILFPALLGTIIEYYDYALYGFCAVILSKHFFPADNPTLALFQTYAVFAIGSLAKPLGAFIFGRTGDKEGRKPSLKRSMIGIAIPTTIIGLLPPYGEWGWLSPVVLLCCRFAQGFFVSGEQDGVRIYILEHVGQHHPCLANSFVNMSAFIGIYFASFAAALAVSESHPWLWRLPFLFGGGLGIIVHVIRRHIQEPALFKDHSTAPLPTKQALLKNWRAIGLAMLLCGSVGGGYHFYLVFLMPYLQKSTGCFTLSEAGFYNANAILLYTFISPIAGYAADRLGIRRVLFIAGLCLAGLALTHFYFIGNGTLPLWLFFLTILPLSAFHSPGYVLLSQQFPIKEKFRCLSLGHSLGSMLFSGSTPAICTALSASFGLLIAPVIYFFILIFFGLFAIFHLKKSPLI